MTQQVQPPSQTQETQVQDLTPDELEHVRGGAGGIQIAVGDLNVQNPSASDPAPVRVRRGTGG